MRIDELTKAVDIIKRETQAALQEVYDELNNGQQKKLLKNENIKALFDRYNVNY